jgi:hypothetical protein
MNILKNLQNTLAIGTLLALMSFRVNEPATHIVGEWSNLRKDQAVKSITFFPTGIVHVMVKGNYVRMYKYKIDKPVKNTNNEITGKMYLTNGTFLVESRNNGADKNTVPFTASIKDGKEMSLRWGKDSSTSAVNLVKSREIGSDMILVK